MPQDCIDDRLSLEQWGLDDDDRNDARDDDIDECSGEVEAAACILQALSSQLRGALDCHSSNTLRLSGCAPWLLQGQGTGSEPRLSNIFEFEFPSLCCKAR